jgi:multicomponent Na+:H+ antiporter subunit A
MTILPVLLGGFLLAPVVGAMAARRPQAVRWLLVGYSLAVALLIGVFYAPPADGSALRESVSWVDALGVTLSFSVDGLSRLFVLLVAGIGALIMLYAGEYLEGEPGLPRLYGFLTLFQASMLGLVLADDLITLFVFWELTSISSYFLIGYHHHDEASRKGALQALLVTGLGGLAMLAGFLLLGTAAGTFSISGISGQAASVRAHPLMQPMLLLILLGAFTKSAQWPFHFWLPNAMAAPTPVSAYLHSATMVKAGIYLLARLTPVFGPTDLWHYLVSSAGALTMVTGAVMALGQTDLKRILAYTTVSALGTLTLLLGLSTDEAVKAAMIFLFVHALYKGALFMIAGSIDHATGTRDIRRLGGLARAMPLTTGAAVLACLSMAGLPPLLGFISKELLYEAKLQAPTAAPFITAAGVAANTAVVAAAALLGIRIFFGRTGDTPHAPHEPPVFLRIGPAVLALTGLVFGLAAEPLAGRLLTPAVQAVRAREAPLKFALWHGFNDVLLLSTLTVAFGIALYLLLPRLSALMTAGRTAARVGPEKAYKLLLDGTLSGAAALTRRVQDGRLRTYVALALSTGLLLAALTLPRGISGWLSGSTGPGLQTAEALLAGVLVAAAAALLLVRSRLAAVALLGVVGFSVAIAFLLFGAPDLAMTQFAVEVLSIIVFVLLLARLPRLRRMSGAGTIVRDVLLAGGAGLVVALLVYVAAEAGGVTHLAQYFGENSLSQGMGRNVVNVIIVDFRALDTLGEISVLLIGALGILLLLRRTRRKGRVA